MQKDSKYSFDRIISSLAIIAINFDFSISIQRKSVSDAVGDELSSEWPAVTDYGRWTSASSAGMELLASNVLLYDFHHYNTNINEARTIAKFKECHELLREHNLCSL